MRYFQSLDIERFVNLLMYNDREIIAICANWEIEKEQICQILHKYFYSLGIFTVLPYRVAQNIRQQMIHQLYNSPEIKIKREIVQKEIAKARERSRSRGVM